MSKPTIEQRLFKCVEGQFCVRGPLTRETTFRYDLHADSLDGGEEKIKTLGDAIDYIASHTRA